jgi:isochorismate synthase EntC
MALVGWLAVTLAAMFLVAIKSGRARALVLLMWAASGIWSVSGGL